MTNPKNIKWSRVHWKPAIFLTLTPIAAVLTSTWYFMSEDLTWKIALLTFFFWLATGMSITAGYHRLFSHKAYKAHWSVRLFYALFGAATFQNSILIWCSGHRVHHRYVDQDKDPYCAKKGLLYSHIGWLFIRVDPPNVEVWGRDLMKDKIVMWQHKHYDLIATLMGFGLPTLLGAAMGSWLGGFALAGAARIVAVHHSTFFINSLCHFFGGQGFSDDHTARDNGLLALFTYGEGYHNFHHQFANDYRNGIRWFDYDPTKWAILGLSRFKLAKDLVKVPAPTILAAKMKMAEKQLQLQLQTKATNYRELFDTKLLALREGAITAQNRWLELKSEMRSLDIEKFSKMHFEQMKRDLKKSRREFKQFYRMWKKQMREIRISPHTFTAG